MRLKNRDQTITEGTDKRETYMRKKKGLVFLILCGILVMMLGGCEEKKDLTLEDIAYDNHSRNYVVYIKEEEDYAPYLVLTSDYHGNVLLLRKYILPELQQYKIHGDGWSNREYGGYYETSSVDQFLNWKFYNSLSDVTQSAIVDSKIQITDIECFDTWNYKTQVISRKVFLLSTVELGVEGLDGSITTKEGNALDYFKDKEYTHKAACFADGLEWSYWTRTPEIGDNFNVMKMGVDRLCLATADQYSGVRPAFCMSKETPIQKSSDVIEGEEVYVIETEE